MIFPFIKRIYKSISTITRRDHQVDSIAKWCIVKDWVAAQLAFIESRQVRTEQAFLPYLVIKDGATLSEKILNDPKFLLGDGEKEQASQEINYP